MMKMRQAIEKASASEEYEKKELDAFFGNDLAVQSYQGMLSHYYAGKISCDWLGTIESGLKQAGKRSRCLYVDCCPRSSGDRGVHG